MHVILEEVGERKTGQSKGKGRERGNDFEPPLGCAIFPPLKRSLFAPPKRFLFALAKFSLVGLEMIAPGHKYSQELKMINTMSICQRSL